MKKILIALLLAALVLAMTGCNRQIFDTTYTFKKAIIRLQDGTIVTGTIQSWRDYDGEQLQIKIDGVTYLVHSANATMIAY